MKAGLSETGRVTDLFTAASSAASSAACSVVMFASMSIYRLVHWLKRSLEEFDLPTGGEQRTHIKAHSNVRTPGRARRVDILPGPEFLLYIFSPPKRRTPVAPLTQLS